MKFEADRHYYKNAQGGLTFLKQGETVILPKQEIFNKLSANKVTLEAGTTIKLVEEGCPASPSTIQVLGE